MNALLQRMTIEKITMKDLPKKNEFKVPSSLVLFELAQALYFTSLKGISNLLWQHKV